MSERRRPSWNAFDYQLEDLPTEKMQKFQHVVIQKHKEDPIYQATMKILHARDKKQVPAPGFIKKIVETVRERKKDIIQYMSSRESEVEEDEFVYDDIVKLTEEVIKHQAEAEFFVEEPKIRPEDDLNKRIVHEIFKTISRMEMYHKKQMDEEEIQMEVGEEEEELETVEAPKPPAPKKSLPTLRLKQTPGGAKVDSGLRKGSNRSKPSIMKKPRMVHDPNVTIVFDHVSQSSLVRGLEEDNDSLLRENLLFPAERNKSPEMEYPEDGVYAEKKESGAGLKVFVTPLTQEIESDDIQNNKKRVSIKKQPMRIKENISKSEELSPSRRLPSLEIISLAKQPELPAQSSFDKEPVFHMTEEILKKSPGEKHHAEVKKHKIHYSRKLSQGSEGKDDLSDFRTFVRQTAEQLGEQEWVREKQRLEHKERRGIRTELQGRFSVYHDTTEEGKRQPLKVTIINLGGDYEKDFIPESNIAWRNENAVQKHKKRIKDSRKEFLIFNLSRRTKGLPPNLRKEYLRNFFSGGREGDVYTAIQNKQKAIRRRHMKYIERESRQRMLTTNFMRDEALDAEIAILEELVRKSQPPEEVAREYARRQYLISLWANSGTTSNTEYWRNPPRGNELVMKEYIRETDFEDILKQRGFFGRKIQRADNSFYVPVTKKEAAILRNKFFEEPILRQQRRSTLKPIRSKGSLFLQAEKWKEDKLKSEQTEEGKVDMKKGADVSRSKKEEKEQTLQDFNKAKPMEHHPFAYRRAIHRGQLRNIQSDMTLVTTKQTQQTLDDKNEAAFKKPRVVRWSPRKKVNTEKYPHKFANKTNKGFLQSFTDIYDVSAKKNVLSYPRRFRV